MTEVTKILIEQCLFGINDTEPLKGEEYLQEAIMQYLDTDNPDYTMMGVLHEAIEYSDNIYAKYIPLLEAVDDIKIAEKEILELKDDKEADPEKKEHLISKVGKAVSKAIRWWYTIDPESKAGNFRIIGKIVVSFVFLILRWKFGGGLAIGKSLKGIGSFLHIKGADKFDPSTNKIFKESEISKKSHINIDTEKATKIMTGAGKVLKESKKAKTHSINLAAILLDAFSIGISKLDSELYYKINSKDLDENIKKYDNLVKEFDEAIDEETDTELVESLKKGKAKAVNALRDLLYVREERTRRENKKKKREEAVNKIVGAVSYKIDDADKKNDSDK